MDEQSDWNRWLLGHGRLDEALLLGLIWFGMLVLPGAVSGLLGVPVAWGQVLGTVGGAGCTAIVWGALSSADQRRGGPRLAVQVASRRKRGLLALGYGAGTGLFAAVLWPPLLVGVPYPPMFSAAGLTPRLLAGGASALWIGVCVLLLVPLGPPPPHQATPWLPGTPQELRSQGLLLLGLAVVLLVFALNVPDVWPLPAGLGGFMGLVGIELLVVALVRRRRTRAR